MILCFILLSVFVTERDKNGFVLAICLLVTSNRNLLLMSLSREEFITKGHRDLSKNAREKCGQASLKHLEPKRRKCWGLEENAQFLPFQVSHDYHFCCFTFYFLLADQILCFFMGGERSQIPNLFVIGFSLWERKTIWWEQVPNCQRVSGWRTGE